MRSRITTRIVYVYFTLALAIAGTHFVAAAMQDDTGPGKWVELSFRLPAIGNVEEVSKWTYGRLVNLTYIGDNDVALTIRTDKGSVQRVVCPKLPFHALAQVSSWMRPSESSVSAKEYTERMVAFTADETSRVIAMVSLEPLPQMGRKLQERTMRASGRSAVNLIQIIKKRNS